MAQKRRKNSVIVSFLCPVELLGSVDAAVQIQGKRTLAVPLNRSSFIIRAITRDLDHSRRSRRSRNARLDSVRVLDRVDPGHPGSVGDGLADATQATGEHEQCFTRQVLRSSPVTGLPAGGVSPQASEPSPSDGGAVPNVN